jgi:hypothetical protein
LLYKSSINVASPGAGQDPTRSLHCLGSVSAASGLGPALAVWVFGALLRGALALHLRDA